MLGNLFKNLIRIASVLVALNKAAEYLKGKSNVHKVLKRKKILAGSQRGR